MDPIGPVAPAPSTRPQPLWNPTSGVAVSAPRSDPSHRALDLQPHQLRDRSRSLRDDGQVALELVQQIADLCTVVHAPLTQRGRTDHRRSGRTAAAGRALPRRRRPAPEPGGQTSLPNIGRNRSTLASRRMTIKVNKATAPMRPDEKGLAFGDGGPPDDGGVRHHRREVDDHPLRQRPALTQPQTHQSGQVHQGRVTGHLPELCPSPEHPR